MSVTNISDKNKYILWAISAGRCQYRGCNNPLHQDILTKRNYNQAYIAHIVADVPGGPRGDETRSPLLADDLSNLMLLCDVHHRLVDKEDVDGHSESILLQMKKEHEERIKNVTDIDVNMMSQMVIYRANIGSHSPNLNYQSLSPFLTPYYPKTARAIDLGLSNSPYHDKNDEFWKGELINLETQFNEQIRPLLRKGEIDHFSIFALAPIPLLIKLGSLINDIHNVEVHQPVRNPKTWNLTDDEHEFNFIIKRPDLIRENVALNISLSASIADERIINTLGENTSIYTITIQEPFNDFLKSKKQLQSFSIEIKKLFNEIKSSYNEQVILNVFPAMPVACAIEMGRSWMPKADMPLMIYDQNTVNNGFNKSIEIRNNG